MSARARLAAAAAALALVSAGAAAQSAGDGPAPPAGPAQAAPGVLARDPAQLPRAPDGRWDGFLDPEHVQANAAALDEAVRAGLAGAQELYRAGDLPGALAALYLALEREPDLPPAWLLLGTCYFRLRRYGDAVTAYERFLRVAPAEAWRTQGLAHAYYSLGRYEEARAHYARVLERLPESVEALRGLALSEQRLGNDARALELLDRALALEPEHADARTRRAHLLVELGRAPEALLDAERACTLAPWEPAPWYARLVALLELGRDEEAAAVEARWRAADAAAQRRRALEAELDTDPRRPDLLASLAREQALAQEVEGLRTSVARLARLWPGEAAELHALALELFELAGDEEGARRAAESLEASAGDDPRAQALLRLYHQRER